MTGENVIVSGRKNLGYEFQEKSFRNVLILSLKFQRIYK